MTHVLTNSLATETCTLLYLYLLFPADHPLPPLRARRLKKQKKSPASPNAKDTTEAVTTKPRLRAGTEMSRAKGPPKTGPGSRGGKGSKGGKGGGAASPKGDADKNDPAKPKKARSAYNFYLLKRIAQVGLRSRATVVVVVVDVAVAAVFCGWSWWWQREMWCWPGACSRAPCTAVCMLQPLPCCWRFHCKASDRVHKKWRVCRTRLCGENSHTSWRASTWHLQHYIRSVTKPLRIRGLLCRTQKKLGVERHV